MKKRNIILLALLFFSLPHRLAFAEPPDFFARFPSADIGIERLEHEVWVEKDGSHLEAIRETRRLLNDRGKENYSEIQCPFEADTQSVSISFANTVNAAGVTIPVEKSAIKDSAPYADYPAYDRTKMKTFTFSGTEPGALTDYALSVKSNNGMLDHDFADSFLLHAGQPALSIRYSLHLPKDKPLKYLLLNPDPNIPVSFNVQDEGKNFLYVWETKNLGYLPQEERMPSWEDRLPRLLLSTATSWEECASWYLTKNQGKAEPDPEIEALALRLTKGLSSEKEKAREIYQWVIKNIRYVSVSMGDAGYEAQKGGEVLKKRYGDCKDGSTLLLALLKAVGITAHYALLSTNDEASVVEAIPSIQQFNHCIAAARLDGKMIFLDSVGKTTRFGEVPEMDRGVRALVLDPQKPFFASIPEAAKGEDFEEKDSTIRLEPSGGLVAEVVCRFGGENESSQREFYGEKNEEEIKTSLEEDSLQSAAGSELLDYRIGDCRDFARPFSYRFRFQNKESALRAGNLMVFRLPGFSTGMYLFEKSERVHPIKSTTGRFVNRARVLLPKGYRIRYLPKPIVLDSPFVSFQGAYRRQGENLFFEAVTEYKGKELPSTAYRKVRELYLKRSRFGKELIVLDKNSSNNGIYPFTKRKIK